MEQKIIAEITKRQKQQEEIIESIKNQTQFPVSLAIVNGQNLERLSDEIELLQSLLLK